jgi:prepilin-type N-terminal cleavage/methylation domain-containing protein
MTSLNSEIHRHEGRAVWSSLNRRGFTLIELLLVIAIISVLVALALPGLAKVRQAARQAQSASNLRSITTAATTYRGDNKGYSPIVLSYLRGIASRPAFKATPWTDPNLEGFASWGFVGKNNSAWWAGPENVNGAPTYDIEAADRPLNRYLFDYEFRAPTPPIQMPPNDPERSAIVTEVTRDPTDNVTYQRYWPADQTRPPVPDFRVSCYEDVGTSYQFQAKWFDQLYGTPEFPRSAKGFYEAFAFGTKRMALAEGFQPARQVWANDQYADVVTNNKNSQLQVRNGYGDINRSLLAFLDGHVKYLPVLPGNTLASYKNSDYTMIYEDLRPPPP